ncbi:MAG: hypothetical protein PHO86_00060 [Bacilli bacterium]|nr:hypothetical protein [Bacilli bacterium]
MGKIFRFIFGLIGLVILLALVGVGIVGGMLFSGKDETPAYVLEDETNSSSYINYMIGEGLKDVEETEDINITLDEEELNYLLNAILRDIKKEINMAPLEINSIYTTINETEGCTVYIPMKAFFFETVVKTSVLITQEDGNIIIELVDLKVGKLSFASNITRMVLGKYADGDSVSHMLEIQGIDATVDFNNFTITIAEDKIEEMILTSFEEDENKDLYETVFSIFFDEDLFEISFGKNNEAGIIVHTAKMSYDKTVDGEDDIDFDMNLVVQNSEKLLNDKTITEDQLNSTFRFLVLGYDRIKDEDLVVINKIDFSSIGIVNKSNYQGIISSEEFSIQDVFDRQLPTSIFDLTNLFTLEITEADFNKIFLGMDLVGTSFAFPYLEDGIYKVSYITINSFFVDIMDDVLEIKLTLDINGKEVVVKTIFEGSKSDNFEITLNFTEMYLGTISGNESNRRAILSYLGDVLSDQEWMTIDSDNLQVTFNFTELITDNPILQAVIQESGTKSSEFFGDNLFSEGYLELKTEINLLP